MNEDNIITIVFTNGKSYNYNDISNTFVNLVENAIENNESVGKLFNQALITGQNLRISHCFPINNTKSPKLGAI